MRGHHTLELPMSSLLAWIQLWQAAHPESCVLACGVPRKCAPNLARGLLSCIMLCLQAIVVPRARLFHHKPGTFAPVSIL